jgi:DnaK suppressor protein
MNRQDIDPAYIERQRARLVALRNDLLSVRRGAQSDERNVNSDFTGHANDAEDDAQRLAAIDTSESLLALNDRRLANIDRALRKIEEGTYGLSDESGERISRQRLEIAPEALLTEEEQRQRERHRP